MAAAGSPTKLGRLRRRRSVWLIVTLVLAAVWISSGWSDGNWFIPSWKSAGRIGHGLVGVAIVHEQGTFQGSPTGVWVDFYDNWLPIWYWLPGFHRDTQASAVWLPIWPFVLAAGAMSVRTTIHARRLARRLTGTLCQKCGYELAGLVQGEEGIACPECGTATTTAMLKRV